ncbi:hypothetical protein T265_00223 [Opisthorchis viverrini]|uniref:Uncharacterized protein n=1 Tax=Opisthorchis viverrini TaxID=6198 RepID=A0A075A2U2_OPIVI|nr:hypothetical protein T265_00223 [Opisthorchis viverrini]KER34038.1 hypothetical protein T265_00223 [Opisthorchis viverrini]
MPFSHPLTFDVGTTGLELCDLLLSNAASALIDTVLLNAKTTNHPSPNGACDARQHAPLAHLLGCTPTSRKWLEREFTDRNVHGSNPISASRICPSRLGRPGSIPALVPPSAGIAARYQKGATAERFFCLINPSNQCYCTLLSHIYLW